MFVKKQATPPSAFPSAIIVVLVLENRFTSPVFFPSDWVPGCQLDWIASKSVFPKRFYARWTSVCIEVIMQMALLSLLFQQRLLYINKLKDILLRQE